MMRPTQGHSSCAPSPPSAPAPAPPGVPSPPEAYQFIILLVLNLLSGTFSGLNLGLMSLTEDDLKVIIDANNDPKEVKWAKKILPLRKRGNLLLCTLLIGNTLVNVMLAILTDPIWVWMAASIFGPGAGTIGTIFGLLVPTALIVIFGEIIPQAYCGRNSLFVGAISVPLVWVFMTVLLPLTYPIALILDRLLGREISSVMTRQMLHELVTLNIESAEHQKKSGLTREDGKLLKGALTFRDRNVGDVMTPLSNCYFLPDTAVLDHPTLMDILAHGHTRVPVYSGTRENVTAILFCKDLLGIGFERKQPLKEVLASFNGDVRDVRVPRAMTLNVAMEHCKRKRTHLLLVCDETDAALATPAVASGTNGADAGASDVEAIAERLTALNAPVVGVATMEDFLEELIQDEIVDETDAWFYDRKEVTDGSKARASPVKKEAVQNKQVDLTAHLRKLGPRESGSAQAPSASSLLNFVRGAPKEDPMAA